MLSNFFSHILIIFSDLGYSGIFVLMVIESSFLPLPSELVIPPAAYLAQRGDLNVFMVVLCGTIGSVVGALFNYFLANKLGRAVIYGLARHKYAKFILISESKVKKAEEYFLVHANFSTFVGRLLPVVRHLISIPAGFCQMNLKSFIYLTAIGSFIWCSILAAIGYFFGAKQKIILDNLDYVAWIGLFLFIIWAIRYWINFSRKK